MALFAHEAPSAALEVAEEGGAYDTVGGWIGDLLAGGCLLGPDCDGVQALLTGVAGCLLALGVLVGVQAIWQGSFDASLLT